MEQGSIKKPSRITSYNWTIARLLLAVSMTGTLLFITALMGAVLWHAVFEIGYSSRSKVEYNDLDAGTTIAEALNKWILSEASKTKAELSNYDKANIKANCEIAAAKSIDHVVNELKKYSWWTTK